MTDTRILVVEDEQIVAEDLKMTLEALGYQVAGIASSGEKAVELAKKENPDLILMDIMLAGEMDGISAASQIRATQDIPVIYVTAFADSTLLERAKQTTPYGYIVKPFNGREVQSNIEIALFKHRMEHEIKKRDAILLALGFGVEWFLRQFTSSYTITPRDVESAWGHDFQPILEQVGIAMGLDRVQIFRFLGGDDKPGFLDLISEWSMEGVPQFMAPEEKRIEVTPWMNYSGEGGNLQAGNPVIVNLEDVSGDERQRMIDLNIRSAIILPVFVEEFFWGIFVFSSNEEREFLEEEVEAMRITVNIISGAIGMYSHAQSRSSTK